MRCIPCIRLCRVSAVAPLAALLAAVAAAQTPSAAPPAGPPSAAPIRIQGKPFFPVGIYNYPKHAPDRDVFKGMAEAGLNFCLLPATTPKEQLDAAQANGLRVMIVIADLMNFSGTPEQIEAKKKSLEKHVGPDSVAFKHPAVIALEGPDEPLWNIKYSGPQRNAVTPEMAAWARPPEFQKEIHALLNGLREGYAWLRSRCGDRYTVWINFAPRGDEDELRWFTEQPSVGGFPQDGRTTADVFGTDVYPVPGGGGSNGWIRGRFVPSAACVGAFAEKLRRAVRPHPCYMVLQGSGIAEWDPASVAAGTTPRRPTFEELQFIVYDAVVHGAGGILFWGADYIDEGSLYWRQIGRVCRTLRALAPVLEEGTDWPDARPGMEQVSALGKIWKDEHIVIATNNDVGAPAPAWIAVPGWRGDRAYSVLDGREAPVVDGVIRDTLPPLGVAVYADDVRLWGTVRGDGNAEWEMTGMAYRDIQRLRESHDLPKAALGLTRGADTLPLRVLFGLPLDQEPFKGKSPAEVAALLKNAGVDGVVAAPHDPKLIDALHAAGIRAYAEIGCFSGRGAWKTHPNTRPVTADGEPMSETEGYGGLCLNQEDYVRDLLTRVDKALGEAAWDGLWLDYIRWPGKWEESSPKLPSLCFCDTCLARFAEDRAVRCPKDLKTTKEKAAWILQHRAADWTAWRCDRVVDVVARIREVLMRRRGPGAVLGIFGVPMRQGDFDGAILKTFGQDWAKLGPTVDVFSPMVYHRMCGRPVDWISGVAGEVRRLSGRTVWPIVQGGDIPPAEFEQALREGLKAPASGVLVFGTSHVVKEGKWDTLARVYREAGAGR